MAKELTSLPSLPGPVLSPDDCGEKEKDSEDYSDVPKTWRWDLSFEEGSVGRERAIEGYKKYAEADDCYSKIVRVSFKDCENPPERTQVRNFIRRLVKEIKRTHGEVDNEAVIKHMVATPLRVYKLKKRESPQPHQVPPAKYQKLHEKISPHRTVDEVNRRPPSGHYGEAPHINIAIPKASHLPSSSSASSSTAPSPLPPPTFSTPTLSNYSFAGVPPPIAVDSPFKPSVQPSSAPLSSSSSIPVGIAAASVPAASSALSSSSVLSPLPSSAVPSTVNFIHASPAPSAPPLQPGSGILDIVLEYFDRPLHVLFEKAEDGAFLARKMSLEMVSSDKKTITFKAADDNSVVQLKVDSIIKVKPA
eukprot:GILK01008950.1.p1 GENE.GILK01008950.1~~GILK01008950.1.p1  ORF type:complete len:371 (+),score=51.41 GILK01008950.1:30-1115(+)